MTECYDSGKEKITFSLILGFLYILFGILQAVASTGVVYIFLVPGNIMGTFVLIVIGSVFLFGHKELEEGISEGVAYIVVGIMLSLIFGALYLLGIRRRTPGPVEIDGECQAAVLIVFIDEQAVGDVIDRARSRVDTGGLQRDRTRHERGNCRPQDKEPETTLHNRTPPMMDGSVLGARSRA